jgi:hypothetical protein
MAEDKGDNKIIIVLEETFKILGLALLSFIVMEIIRPKIITAYLNLNFLLLVWLAIGILILVLIKRDK